MCRKRLLGVGGKGCFSFGVKGCAARALQQLGSRAVFYILVNETALAE